MSTGTIQINSAARRAALVAAALACVFLAYLFASWFFGNTVALRSVYKEIAAVSVGMAPADPQTHFSAAVLLEKTFLPDDLPRALAEYETAAALSPADFRFWLDLGRARARAGDADGAEAALRRALALAPNYSQIQWALGNQLLREEKYDEAFALIRRAAENDSAFANPAIASAWQLFGGDAARLRAYAGDSPNLKAALAAVFAREKRFDEALAIWNTLPEEARRADFRANGEEIYQRMLEAREYRPALDVYSSIAATDDRRFVLGRITNGGFELENPKAPSVFEWQIADGVEPQIGVDNTQKHGGAISLKMIFNNVDGKAFRGVAQTVAVESGRRYAFETFYRSELETNATVKWEIVDAADAKTVLGATEPVAPKADWTALRAEFTVPETVEAVTLRLVRVPCTATLCPISGRLWFDDFSLGG